MYVEVTMYAYCKYKGVYMEIYYVYIIMYMYILWFLFSF